MELLMRTRFVLLLLLPVVAGGCLFEPRDAEPPSTVNPIEYLPRTSPENVWENCSLALENDDATGWDNAVHESFLYEPDSQTLSLYPAAFATPWGKAREMSFVNAWFSNRPIIQANLLDERISTPDGSGGRAEWDIIYFLNVKDRQTGSTSLYRARATLVFELKGNYWFLTYWRDESGESDPNNPQVLLPTLGVVRGAFAG
jgi:hypothetical protein